MKVITHIVSKQALDVDIAMVADSIAKNAKMKIVSIKKLTAEITRFSKKQCKIICR
ncbi:MAG: hypothetical protein ACT4OH_00195 [Methylophilaceae bacterium]